LTGLPDFHANNTNLGTYILERLGMEQFWFILCLNGIFYGHFVYFMDHLVNFVVIWYILPAWNVLPRKIWQPCSLMADVKKVKKIGIEKGTCVWVRTLQGVQRPIFIFAPRSEI
jgi:hypothetical protein